MVGRSSSDAPSAGRCWADQLPSPPLAVQARGSQGANGSTLDVGAWKAPELPVFPDVPVLPAVVGVVLGVAAPAGAVVVVAGGALTVKSVPVTTVTCEPGFTWVGSMAMMTAPDMEFATACAAAS